MHTNIVELHHLAKSYGDAAVLCEINLTVRSGDFMVVYGAPSSGKSVLMRTLVGLEQPDTGQITMRGSDVTRLAAGMRNIGYVPQSFALFPNWSVFDNIGYPLKLAGTDRKLRERLVRESAELLDIHTLLDRKPNQLSGGQKQRVAIARGLVKETEIYVLDDPLVGLDFKLREKLIEDLKRTQETLGVTFIYVTSDPIETMMLAKRIAVLDDGIIAECGEPESLYFMPQRGVTLRNIGFPNANFLPIHVENQRGHTPFMSFPLPPSRSLQPHDLAAGIRPEHINLLDVPPDNAIICEGALVLRENLGAEEIVYLDANGILLRTVLSRQQSDSLAASLGSIVSFWIDPIDIVLFQHDHRIATVASA